LDEVFGDEEFAALGDVGGRECFLREDRECTQKEKQEAKHSRGTTGIDRSSHLLEKGFSG
jgi:hypothetical protein